MPDPHPDERDDQHDDAEHAEHADAEHDDDEPEHDDDEHEHDDDEPAAGPAGYEVGRDGAWGEAPMPAGPPVFAEPPPPPPGAGQGESPGQRLDD